MKLKTMLNTKHMLTTNRIPAYPADALKYSRLRDLVDKKTMFFIFKRGADITLSLFVTIFILSWIMPLIAIAIKLSSRGPVFFIQKRVGKGMKSFGCIKFRTMRHCYKNVPLKSNDDNKRITPLGKFLRKTSLDELPQFLNVLMGDMSIVGPRPHMLSDCRRFSVVVRNYKFRCLVKPGITGLAQVKGFRGPVATTEHIIMRYQFDKFYIHKASLWLDLQIMINTAAQILKSIFYHPKAAEAHPKVNKGISTDIQHPVFTIDDHGTFTNNEKIKIKKSKVAS